MILENKMTILEDSTIIMETSEQSSQVKHDKQTLRESVEMAMSDYFAQLDGQEVIDLYELVISEVEAPLMEAVMAHTRGNQTKASAALGLNRGTLRKKLKKYNML